MPEIQHLSYSSISAYQSCPAFWKFRYIDKVQAPTSVNLVFGSAWHNTIEEHIVNQAERKPSDLLAIWSTKWNEQISKDQVIDWGLDTPEHFHNEGIRMLQCPDVAKLLLDLRPKKRGKEGWAIEQYCELKVPGVPIPVIGYIDLITEDGIPNDFKTSSRSWSSDQAASELQPIFYLAALNQSGQRTPGMRFRHHVFTKTKTVNVQTFETVFKLEQMFWLFEMIRGVWEAIEKESYPMNPTGWKCNPRFCEYWRMCRGKYE